MFLTTPNSVGEVAAGKASRSLAQHIPGPGGIEGMKGAASGVVGELARARIALDERGQKLGELEERTAAMMASADSFSKHAHEVKKNIYICIFIISLDLEETRNLIHMSHIMAASVSTSKPVLLIE